MRDSTVTENKSDQALVVRGDGSTKRIMYYSTYRQQYIRVHARMVSENSLVNETAQWHLLQHMASRLTQRRGFINVH
jgi:hypothetical protein